MSFAQHPKLRLAASLIAALALVAPSLPAQDTRTVQEPAIPPACITLRAVLTTASATSGASIQKTV